MVSPPTISGTCWCDEIWGATNKDAAFADEEAGLVFQYPLAVAVPQLCITSLTGDPLGTVQQILWALRVDLRVLRTPRSGTPEERYAIRQRSLKSSMIFDLFDTQAGEVLGTVVREPTGLFATASWRIADANGGDRGALRVSRENRLDWQLPSGEAVVCGAFVSGERSLRLKVPSPVRQALSAPLILATATLAMARQYGVL